MNALAPDEIPMEKLAQDVLESLLEGCQVIGYDFKYLYVNPAVVAQGHRSKQELLGRTMMECYPGIDQTPMFTLLRRCLKERQYEQMENEFTYPDGTSGWFELRFVPVPEGVCILSLDVTKAKLTAQSLHRAETQLRQAQKMDAIGRLAGGIAHDFNNMLSVILSYPAIILAGLSPSDPIRADLEEILKAGQRASELTRQLLAFCRQQALKPRILDVNEVIVSIEKMIRRLVSENIELRFAATDELWKVKADPSQIEQVVMNLVVNARDAMPNGGTVTLETQNVELDPFYTDQHIGVAPGPYVMLAVSDTGIGMDKETQEKIFEPFFTTKQKGKGTGFGLSTVFGIVQQSGGHIWVYSEPGQGASFKVYFPRSKEAVAVATTPTQVSHTPGSETVLLVEDEEQLRVVARSILKGNGYHILEAKDGNEALLLSQTYQAPIHLLLTDVIMPQMGGKELAEQLMTARPDMRLLYMSGFPPGTIKDKNLISQGSSFLHKPITPESLLLKVREVLDTPSAGAPQLF